MKTVTIIFVALTVFSGLFLESASAPNLLGDLLGNILGKVVEGGRQNNLVGGGVGLVKHLSETGLEPGGDLISYVQKLLKLVGVKSEIKETLESILKELEQINIEINVAIKNRDLGLIQKILKLLYVVLGKFNTTHAQLMEKYGADAKNKQLLDEITKRVEDFVSKLVKLVKAFLKEIFDKISIGLLSKLHEFVAGLIKALDKVIAEASGDKFKELRTKIIDLVYKLRENTVEINNAFPKAITGNLDKLLSLIACFKSNIAELKQICVHTDLPDDVKNILHELIGLVDVPQLECIFEILKNLPVTIIGKVFKEVNALFKGLLENIPLDFSELRECSEKLRVHLCDLLISLENGDIVAVQNHEVLACNANKKLKAIVAKLFDKQGELLENVLQTVERIIEKVFKVLKPIIKTLANGLNVIVSKLIVGLAGILKNIKEALAVAKGELKELLIIIQALLKALIEKLLDLIKAVVALVSNVTGESVNKVNGIRKAIEDIFLEILGMNNNKESENGKVIGKEYVSPILELALEVNKVLVLSEVIVKASQVNV